jgi:hypothetical protein
MYAPLSTNTDCMAMICFFWVLFHSCSCQRVFCNSRSSAVVGSVDSKTMSLVFLCDITIAGRRGGIVDAWIGEEDTRNAADVARKLVMACLIGGANGLVGGVGGASIRKHWGRWVLSLQSGELRCVVDVCFLP